MTATRSIKAPNTNKQTSTSPSIYANEPGSNRVSEFENYAVPRPNPHLGRKQGKAGPFKATDPVSHSRSRACWKATLPHRQAAFQLLLGRALRSYLSSSWPGSPPPVKAQPNVLHSRPHFLRSPPPPWPVLGRRVPSSPDRLGPGAAFFSAEHRCHSQPPCCARRQKRRDGRASSEGRSSGGAACTLAAEDVPDWLVWTSADPISKQRAQTPGLAGDGSAVAA